MSSWFFATRSVGPNTWRRLMEEAYSLPPVTTPPPTEIPPFPGNLSVGSSGASVSLLQQAINTIAPCHPGRLWILAVDGNFGNMTRDAVFSFQSVFQMPITGVVNQATWDRLMREAADVSAYGCGGNSVSGPPLTGAAAPARSFQDISGDYRAGKPLEYNNTFEDMMMIMLANKMLAQKYMR